MNRLVKRFEWAGGKYERGGSVTARGRCGGQRPSLYGLSIIFVTPLFTYTSKFGTPRAFNHNPRKPF
jgi:hypothetical protein